MENVRGVSGQRDPFGRHGRKNPGRTAAESGDGGEGFGIFIGGMQGAADLMKMFVTFLAEIIMEHDHRTGEDEHEEGE